jgi:hypothetical protein
LKEIAMTGLIDDLIAAPWDFLTSNLVGLTMLVIAGAIAISIGLSLAERVGRGPLAIGIGALAAAAGAGWWYVAAPFSIEARENSREKSAFDRLYSEAKVRPTYELTVKPGDWPRSRELALTIQEARGDYLVKSVYEGYYGDGKQVDYMSITLERVTISLQDRNMHPVARPKTYKLSWKTDVFATGVVDEPEQADLQRIDLQRMIPSLSAGTVTIGGHDQRIDEHFRAVKEYLDKKTRYEAEYAKRAQRGME